MTPRSTLAGIAPPTRLVGAPTPAREPERTASSAHDGDGKDRVAPPPKRPFSEWLRETRTARGNDRASSADDRHGGSSRDAAEANAQGSSDPDDASSSGEPAGTTTAARSIAPKPRAVIPGGRRDGSAGKAPASSTDAEALSRSAETSRREADAQDAAARTTGILADRANALDAAAAAALAADRRSVSSRSIGDGSTAGRALDEAARSDGATDTASLADAARSSLSSATSAATVTADDAGKGRDRSSTPALGERGMFALSAAELNIGAAGSGLHAATRSAEATDPTGAARLSTPVGSAFSAPGATPLGSPSPATATATIAVPVPSPDFASSLGVQLCVFARDGIQHAELHLNPAEMGPLSIRIELDGHAARVAFSADHAATRQAIESGLPALAGALADAGFSLAGGGVSSRSREHDADPAADDDARRGSARTRRVARGGEVQLAAPIARGITARTGGVDVYA